MTDSVQAMFAVFVHWYKLKCLRAEVFVNPFRKKSDPRYTVLCERANVTGE